MTYLFTNIRLSAYLAVGTLAAVVLGFAAYFASVFLPDIHRKLVDVGVLSGLTDLRGDR